MLPPHLSVIVPAFEEAAVLAENLTLLAKHLEGLGLNFEILCVDDGSRDGTPALVARLESPLRGLTHPTNLGKGAAVRTGVLAARGERIVFLDADLSTDLAALTPLLAALDAGADVALGSRRVFGARIERRQPWRREFAGRVFSALARWTIAPAVSDFTCGFKGFRRDAAQAIFRRARVDRWAFDAEVIAIADALGLVMVQVPVTWRHAGGSKVRVVGAAAGSLRELLGVALRRRFGDLRR